MEAIPELHFENHPSPEDEFYLRCQWATLRLRLAVYVQSEGLSYLHTRNCNIPAKDAEFEEFLAQFQSSVSFHVDKRLKECNKLCAGRVKDLFKATDIEPVEKISQMLVGVVDKDASEQELFTKDTRQIKDITVLEDGRLSVSLLRLLSSRDPDMKLKK
eukprot:5577348-Pleurochrysis_carterae.AAC.1